MLTQSDRRNLAALATFRLAAAIAAGDINRANREGLSGLAWYANHQRRAADRLAEHRAAGA